MQGRRQPHRAEQRTPPARLDHGHIAGPADAARNPYAPIEADEIGAASEQHVLTVVYHLADARMEIGRGPSTQVAATLDELHMKARLGQRAGRAHACNAATDDGDSPLRTLAQLSHTDRRATAMRAKPTAKIASFCAIGTLARRVKTS